MNTFSEFDHKLRALQDSVDWAVGELKVKDSELSDLRWVQATTTTPLEISNQCVRLRAELREVRSELSARDKQIAGLKQHLKAHIAGAFNDETQKLRAELSTANERAYKTTTLLFQVQSWFSNPTIPIKDVVENIRAFLNPPAEKPEENQPSELQELAERVKALETSAHRHIGAAFNDHGVIAEYPNGYKPGMLGAKPK